MKPVENTSEWKALSIHARQLRRIHLRRLFAGDLHRAERFSLADDDLMIDFSKQRIDDETFALLLNLAASRGVIEQARAMAAGAILNPTERRPVLHTALRLREDASLFVAGVDLGAAVRSVRERMAAISGQVRDGNWKGITGKVLRTVVHLGIGGSALPLQAALEALRPHIREDIQIHILSNIDGAALQELWPRIDPETTLFIVASKTFTTEETLANARTLRDRLGRIFPWSEYSRAHFVAVSTALDRIGEFGIPPEHILPMWDWVGGRFSLCSAVGLALMIGIGPDRFLDMLTGYAAMDRHFLETPTERNLPVILALLDIWNHQFLGFPTRAVLAYDHRLRTFPAYVQELEMESNGKSVGLDGRPIKVKTAPVVWGGTGTDAQHAFFQHLHQGTQIVPTDFIACVHPDHSETDHHQRLLANCLAQSQALAFGKTAAEVRREGLDPELLPHKVFTGNRPSTTILLDRLTPRAYGRLMAMYEHKTAVLGWIWGINSFDQFGVELGKVQARQILPLLAGEGDGSSLDSSTRLLLFRIGRQPSDSIDNP